jgi:hypothetical protein
MPGKCAWINFRVISWSFSFIRRVWRQTTKKFKWDISDIHIKVVGRFNVSRRGEFTFWVNKRNFLEIEEIIAAPLDASIWIVFVNERENGHASTSFQSIASIQPFITI